MNRKNFTILIAFLSFSLMAYSQADSARTINDKPGTPQSLRAPDQSPQSHAVINPPAAPLQATDYSTNGNSGINNTIITNQNTGQQVPASPIAGGALPATRTDSAVSNSAIRNGVSNVTNPIRNK